MLSFTLGKLIRALTVLLGVSFLTFIIGHSSGDPVATHRPRRCDRRAEGRNCAIPLDWIVPYSSSTGSMLVTRCTVTWAFSYRQHVDVSRLIALRLANSLELAGAAFVLAMGVGFVLGILCVIYRDSVLDNVIAGLSVLAQVVPGFWLGLVLVLLFAVHWRVFPVSGAGDLTHLILPAVTLALPTLGRMTRLVRGGMLEVLQSDYIRTARAKGLSERQVLLGPCSQECFAALGYAGRTGTRRSRRQRVYHRDRVCLAGARAVWPSTRFNSATSLSCKAACSSSLPDSY